jgi:hypothetical protein
MSFVTPIADDNIMTFAITFTPRSEDDPYPCLVIGEVQQGGAPCRWQTFDQALDCLRLGWLPPNEGSNEDQVY